MTDTINVRIVDSVPLPFEQNGYMEISKETALKCAVGAIVTVTVSFVVNKTLTTMTEKLKRKNAKMAAEIKEMKEAAEKK